jgi:hypothetical protein
MFACGNGTVEPTYYWGELNIEYENDPLSGMPFMRENSFSPKTLNLIADFFDDNGVEVGHLVIYKIPFEERRVEINMTDPRDADGLTGANFFIKNGDDALEGHYEIAEVAEIDNYIEITEIVLDEVSGKFELAFVKDSLTALSREYLPDTMIFRNGTFHTRVVD